MGQHEEKIELLRKYSSQIKTSFDFHVGTDIPSKKINNATTSFAHGLDRTKIIGFYDTTVMGSGKSGYIFTDTQIYYRETLEKPKQLLYKDIQRVELYATHKKDCDRGIRIYLCDGTSLSWNTCFLNKTPLLELLNSLKQSAQQCSSNHPETVAVESAYEECSPRAPRETSPLIESSNAEKQQLSEKDKAYQHVTDTLLSFCSNLFGFCDYIKGAELSSRQNKILTKNYGTAFSRDQVLFAEKFLISAEDAVTKETARLFGLDSDVCKNRMLNFKHITEIEYTAMPLHREIWITLSGSKKRIHDGLPIANSYSDIKYAAKAIEEGYYKKRTVWLVAVIYALTAMARCRPNEYLSKAESVNENLLKLLECCQKGNSSTCFYGDLPSFDFVECVFSADTVEKDLDTVSMRLEEAKEEAKAERMERITEAVSNHIEYSMQDYERRKAKAERDYERMKERVERERNG